MSGPGSPEAGAVARGAAWRAVALLTAAYVLSYVDRTILSLLVGPIRGDLGISDTQFSLLHGFAFAIFYTLLGVPFGRWADRGDRRRIVALGIFLWSLATAACGLAKSFVQLFLARIGVGVGEAALSPAAYSLIADLVPRAQLGRALGVYGAGVYLGIGATFAGGGWLVTELAAAGPATLPLLGMLQPWQLAFLGVGLPGVVLALVAALCLPEPRDAGHSAAASVPRAPLLPYLRRHRGFLLAHFLGFAMLTMAFNGYLTWAAEYFLRAHGWSKALSGGWLGLVILVAGTAGMLIGGSACDRRARAGDPRAALTVAVAASAFLLPWPFWTTRVADPWLSLLGFAPIVFGSSLAFAAAITGLQTAVPPRLRGQVSALYLFVVNLAGIGFGGTAVALVSDGWLRDEARLGDAMAIVGSVAVLLALPLLTVARRNLPQPADD